MTIKLRTTLGSNARVSYPYPLNPKYFDGWRHWINTFTSPHIFQINFDGATTNGTTEEEIEGGEAAFLSACDNVGVDLKAVSDSVQDKAAGTGMFTALLIGLNKDGAYQETVITLNGDTEVAISGKHGAVSFLIGLTGSVAAGNITIYNGANVYLTITAGNSTSNGSRLYLPCDKAYKVMCVEVWGQPLTRLNAGDKILVSYAYNDFNNHVSVDADKNTREIPVDQQAQSQPGCYYPRVVTALTPAYIKFTDKCSAAQNEQYNLKIYIAIAER